MAKKKATLEGQGQDIVGVDKFFSEELPDKKETKKKAKQVGKKKEKKSKPKEPDSKESAKETELTDIEEIKEVEREEKPIPKEAVLQEEGQYVVFELAKETYALPVNNVREIVPLTTITSVPRSPDYVAGIINLRGSVVPVLNFHRRLGLEEMKETKQSRIMVVELGKEEVGLLVDSVSEVLRIKPEQVGVPSELLSGPEGDYLTGVANINNRLILLLDLNRVLEKKIVLEKRSRN